MIVALHDSPAADRLGPHTVQGDVLTGLADDVPPAGRFVV